MDQSPRHRPGRLRRAGRYPGPWFLANCGILRWLALAVLIAAPVFVADAAITIFGDTAASDP
jgi:hypothetical protein